MSLPADRIYLFDTSIWGYTTHPLIASDWQAAGQKNQHFIWVPRSTL